MTSTQQTIGTWLTASAHRVVAQCPGCRVGREKLGESFGWRWRAYSGLSDGCCNGHWCGHGVARGGIPLRGKSLESIKMANAISNLVAPSTASHFAGAQNTQTLRRKAYLLPFAFLIFQRGFLDRGIPLGSSVLLRSKSNRLGDGDHRQPELLLRE